MLRGDAEPTLAAEQHHPSIEDRPPADGRHVVHAEGDPTARFPVRRVHQSHFPAVAQEADGYAALAQQALYLRLHGIVPGPGERFGLVQAP